MYKAFVDDHYLRGGVNWKKLIIQASMAVRRKYNQINDDPSLHGLSNEYNPIPAFTAESINTSSMYSLTTPLTATGNIKTWHKNGYDYVTVDGKTHMGRNTDVVANDYCKITDGCTKGLGINRMFMPQVADKLKRLAVKISDMTEVPPSQIYSQKPVMTTLDNIIPMQGNALKGKIFPLYQDLAIRGKNPDLKMITNERFDKTPSNFSEKLAQITTEPFAVVESWDSVEGKYKTYLLDGHHRYYTLALYNTDAKKNNWPLVGALPADVITLPKDFKIEQLLAITLGDNDILQRQMNKKPSILQEYITY